MTFTKEEREKNKVILRATLNYLLEFHSGDMVFDGVSHSKMWYLQEIKQAEKYIEKSQSAQIKRKLDMHISLLKHKFDLGLNTYIRENTGYEIDIYEAYKAYVVPIIARGGLLLNDNFYEIEKYLRAYGAQPEEQEHVRLLKTLLAERQAELSRSDSAGETIMVKGYDIVEGRKSFTLNETEFKEFEKQWLQSEETSPNGQLKLKVQISGKGAHAQTYVVVKLPGGEGGIYGAIGEKLPIKAYWQDNNHIVIETSKDYEHFYKHQELSSYGELFKIEYRS